MLKSKKQIDYSKSEIEEFHGFLTEIANIQSQGLKEKPIDITNEDALDHFIDHNLTADCLQTDQILDFLNNNLSNENRFTIIQHLSSCKVCRVRLKEQFSLMNQSVPLFDKIKNKIQKTPQNIKNHLNLIKIKMTEEGLKLLEASENLTGTILKPQLSLRKSEKNNGNIIIQEKDLDQYHIRINLEQKNKKETLISIIIKEKANDELVEDCDIQIFNPLGQTSTLSSKLGRVEYKAQRIGNYFISSSDWGNEKILVYIN